MPRKLKLVDDALAKSSQFKLRNYFKTENNLARNTSEKKLISFFGFNTKQEMYHSMADDFNAYATRENAPIDDSRRLLRNTQAVTRRVVAKRSKVETKAKSTISNWIQSKKFAIKPNESAFKRYS